MSLSLRAFFVPLVLLVLIPLSGCISDPDDNDSVRGFTEDDLSSPSTKQSFPDQLESPPQASSQFKIGYNFSLRWTISDVYPYIGGTVNVWMTNLGSNTLFAYSITIEPDWAVPDRSSSSSSASTGVTIGPQDEFYLGLLAFRGPKISDIGEHDYSLRVSIMVSNDDGGWYDSGPVGNSSETLEVLPLGTQNDYELISNPSHYWDKINELVDPSDPEIFKLSHKIARDYEGPYNIFQVLAIFDYVNGDDIKYVGDPAGQPNYWATPAETLEIGCGDCEDQAVLICSLTESIGGTARIFITDSHAFAGVFIGSTTQERDDTVDAINRYYRTSLVTCFFHDELGYWLMADTLRMSVLGGLPGGSAPMLMSESEKDMVPELASDLLIDHLTWDIIDSQKLQVVDVVASSR